MYDDVEDVDNDPQEAWMHVLASYRAKRSDSYKFSYTQWFGISQS